MLCQDLSDISARPSGRSWKEAGKAEFKFSEVHTSLQRPAGRPLRTLQKGHYIFGFSLTVSNRRAPHPVIFANFPAAIHPQIAIVSLAGEGR